VKRAAGLLLVGLLAGCATSSAANAAKDTVAVATKVTVEEPAAGFGEGPAKGPCRSVPPAPSPAVSLAWLPPDLPLPPGTYALEDQPSAPAPAGARAHRGLFVVAGDGAAFLRFAITSWPVHGWRLARGESEHGEAEDTFDQAGSSVRGHFRIRSAYCDLDRTELLLQLVS
jgi:hypothetical protein